jgi:hypothetical protein
MTVRKTGKFPVFLTVMVLFLSLSGGKLSNFHAGLRDPPVSEREVMPMPRSYRSESAATCGRDFPSFIIYYIMRVSAGRGTAIGGSGKMASRPRCAMRKRRRAPKHVGGKI